MAHYDRYLELLAQHNATGRAEDALQRGLGLGRRGEEAVLGSFDD